MGPSVTTEREMTKCEDRRGRVGLVGERVNFRNGLIDRAKHDVAPQGIDSVGEI